MGGPAAGFGERVLRLRGRREGGEGRCRGSRAAGISCRSCWRPCWGARPAGEKLGADTPCGEPRTLREPSPPHRAPSRPGLRQEFGVRRGNAPRQQGPQDGVCARLPGAFPRVDGDTSWGSCPLAACHHGACRAGTQTGFWNVLPAGEPGQHKVLLGFVGGSPLRRAFAVQVAPPGGPVTGPWVGSL